MIAALSAKHLQPPLRPLLRRHVSAAMEVEVKLRLPSAASHQTLLRLLSPFHVQTLIQQNLFFDGAATELSAAQTTLRLRFSSPSSPRCVLSLKSNPSLSAGISRVEEHEEPFDPSLGRAAAAEPWRLLSVESSEIIKRIRNDFPKLGLVCLGGFKNVRSVFDWEGLELEIDETIYDFGTNYEIECESSDPNRAKKLIEGFLGQNGISYSYSEMNKFSVFRSGKLPL